MFKDLLLFITGLTLFLFGMFKLSSGMQELFSSRIREYIRLSVRRPVYGLFLGIISTILFQSSSATTLVTIGIVSAGLITFLHSLGIILGADIGTTLTAQLVVWKVTSISPVLIFLGGLLYFVGKEHWKMIGEVTLYFGLIFYGLSLIGDATAPLKENQAFFNFFQEARSPLIGLGLGLLFTGIVQASAIPIGILIVLGQQGLITIENALPIVLGANIGTTVTALIGSTVTNINGKKTALAHLFFKVFGVFICFVLLPLMLLLLKYLSSDIAQQIALGHFLLNFVIVVVFISLLRPFSRLIETIIPGTDHVLPMWPEFLDKTCLASPEEALLCAKKELGREIMLAQRMLSTGLALISHFRSSGKRDVMYIELVVDNIQSEITRYLWNISCGQLSPAHSRRLFAFSSIVYDIERIGDRSMNLVELAESRHNRKAVFSDAAKAELEEVAGLVVKNVDYAAQIIEDRNGKTLQAMAERHLQVLVAIKIATDNHLVRFYQKACRAEAGPIFVDILVNLARISDHSLVIAEHMCNMDEKNPQIV